MAARGGGAGTGGVCVVLYVMCMLITNCARHDVFDTMDPTSGITRPTHASIHARYEASPDARGATHNHWTHPLQSGASATPIVHGAMDNDMKARTSGQSFSLKTQPYWMRNKPVVSVTSSVWVQPAWPIGCRAQRRLELVDFRGSSPLAPPPSRRPPSPPAHLTPWSVRH